MNSKIKHKIKIILVMMMALVLVGVIRQQKVFLGESPRIHPLFLARVQGIPQYIAQLVQQPNRLIAHLKEYKNALIPFQPLPDRPIEPIPDSFIKAPEQVVSSLPTIKPPSSLQFLPVVRGVYAAEDTATNKTYYKIPKGTKIRIEENVLPDGRREVRITPL